MTTSFHSFFRAAFFVLFASLLVACAEEPRETGLRLYQNNQYADAAGAFRNAVRRDPLDYKSYYYLGIAYEQLKAPQLAIESFKSGLDVMDVTHVGQEDYESRAKIMDALAVAIAVSDQRDIETNALVEQARARGSSQTCLILAKIARYRGDADGAMDWYNRAAILNDRDFRILKEDGLYLEKLGQAQKAEVPLRRAYALNSNDPEVIAALRRIGIVPGPSLKDREDLAPPLLPQGPLPEVDVEKLKETLGIGHNSSSRAASTATPPATDTPAAQPVAQPAAATAPPAD